MASEGIKHRLAVILALENCEPSTVRSLVKPSDIHAFELHCKMNILKTDERIIKKKNAIKACSYKNHIVRSDFV